MMVIIYLIANSVFFCGINESVAETLPEQKNQKKNLQTVQNYQETGT